MITEKDMYGHQIQLNFNQKGDEKKTFLGGLLSSILKLIMLVFACILLLRMVSKSNDNNSGFETVFNETQTLRLDEAYMRVFHLLKRMGKVLDFYDTLRHNLS